MASLNHERVVKLLGVIMEDRDYSLVMELMPRGNLLVMLETVSGFLYPWSRRQILTSVVPLGFICSLQPKITIKI